MAQIDCRSHGRRASAVVCGHMLAEQDARAGFVENSDDPDDREAWCDECVRMFVAEGAMTPAFRAFDAMALVCDRRDAGLERRRSREHVMRP